MPEAQPNILVIWGDDIGITNLTARVAERQAPRGWPRTPGN